MRRFTFWKFSRTLCEVWFLNYCGMEPGIQFTDVILNKKKSFTYKGTVTQGLLSVQKCYLC